jgi:hypothetical protein
VIVMPLSSRARLGPAVQYCLRPTMTVTIAAGRRGVCARSHHPALTSSHPSRDAEIWARAVEAQLDRQAHSNFAMRLWAASSRWV